MKNVHTGIWVRFLAFSIWLLIFMIHSFSKWSSLPNCLTSLLSLYFCGFYNWNAPFHVEMCLVSLWKEDKTNWQVWQSLVLSLTGRDGSWQQKELNAQILNLSDSRCMFKRENKGPSGMKLRILCMLSVVRKYTALLFTSVCPDFLSSPNSLPLQHCASTCWKKCYPKGDTCGCHL